LLLSNKPLYPRKHYAAKLSRLGFLTEAEEGYFCPGIGLSPEIYRSPSQALCRGRGQLKNELRSYGLTVLGEFIEDLGCPPNDA